LFARWNHKSNVELPGLEQEIQDFCRETVEFLLEFRDSFTPKHKAIIVECLSVIKLDENIDLVIRALPNLNLKEIEQVAESHNTTSLRVMLKLAKLSKAFTRRCTECLYASIVNIGFSDALNLFIEHLQAGHISSAEMSISYYLKDKLSKGNLMRINQCLGDVEWQGEDSLDYRDLRRREAMLWIDEKFTNESHKIIDSHMRAFFDYFRMLKRMLFEAPLSLFTEDSDSEREMFYESIREILDCVEAFNLNLKFLEVRENISYFIQYGDLTDQQIELKADYAKEASNSIYSKLKDLSIEHLTIPTSILFYVISETELVRFKSGGCQVLLKNLDRVVCWHNYDNLKLYTCLNQHNRALYFVFDLKRDLSQTLFVKGLKLTRQCRITVFEGFLYVMDIKIAADMKLMGELGRICFGFPENS